MWLFCHFVNRLTNEYRKRRRPNSAGMGKWLTFGGDACGFWITFYFLHHCRIWHYLTFVSISHTINGRFVPYLAKWLTPQHFGMDPTDIQIRINPKIWIRITDHFCFRFWHWWRFALSESACIYSCYYSRFSLDWPNNIQEWRLNLEVHKQEIKVQLHTTIYETQQNTT